MLLFMGAGSHFR